MSETSVSDRRWVALVLLCLAQFMLIVDITVVQVALPSIGADLTLARETLTWVVTGYTLCFGGLMVLGGRLADVFGTRRTLLAGLTVFTAASLLCGLSTTGELLLTGRVAQGVGAALLSPAALAAITGMFHGPERHRALGAWAAIGGTGAAAGVLLGGLLTQWPGWEWVFFVNLPVGASLLLALPSVLPKTRLAGQGGADLRGGLLVTAATAALLYGLTVAGDAGWTTPVTLLPLAGAVLGYGAFILVERRAATPLLQPRTLARRPVIAGTVVMLVASGLMLSLFFLSSLYLQHTLRFSALATGLLFLPVAVVITIGAHLAGRLIGRIGGRAVATAGFAMVIAGAGLLTQVAPDSNPYLVLLPGFLLAALGIGPAFVTATTMTMANVPHEETGVASGVINTGHELGGSLGVAIVSTVAAGSLTEGAAGTSGFAAGYLFCAVLAAVTAVVAVRLVPAGRPKAIIGHVH